MVMRICAKIEAAICRICDLGDRLLEKIFRQPPREPNSGEGKADGSSCS